jgi:hypothetical protein
MHRAIETYQIPRKLVGRVTPVGAVPSRITPIFRDRDELSASSDLTTELCAARAVDVPDRGVFAHVGEISLRQSGITDLQTPSRRGTYTGVDRRRPTGHLAR